MRFVPQDLAVAQTILVVARHDPRELQMLTAVLQSWGEQSIQLNRWCQHPVSKALRIAVRVAPEFLFELEFATAGEVVVEDWISSPMVQARSGEGFELSDVSKTDLVLRIEKRAPLLALAHSAKLEFASLLFPLQADDQYALHFAAPVPTAVWVCVREALAPRLSLQLAPTRWLAELKPQV